MIKLISKWSILGICLLTLAFDTANAQTKEIIKETINTKSNSYDKTLNTVTSGVSTVYEDVKSTAPKIQEALNSIGKELKVGAHNVWNILVRQQIVWSIGFLILTISSLINWFMFYRRNLSIKLVKYERGTRDIIGDIPNPLYNSYYGTRSEYKTDPRAQTTKKGPVGVEECLLVVPNNEPIKNFKYLHLLICIGLSVLSIWHFMDMITGFINPEFGAMKTIAEIATQIK